MSTKRNQYKFPRWFVEALKVYFLEARPVFLKKNANQREQSIAMRFERLDPSDAGEEKRPIRTEVLFVNSNGNPNIRPKLVNDCFMAYVQKKLASRAEQIRMKVAEQIPLTCCTDVRIAKLKKRHPKYTRNSLATASTK